MGADIVTVNVVVLAGTVAADPVQRRMPSGDEVTEIRLLSESEAVARYGALPGHRRVIDVSTVASQRIRL